MNAYLLTDIAILERVGAEIKACRIASRLSQKQLATDAGVVYAQILKGGLRLEYKPRSIFFQTNLKNINKNILLSCVFEKKALPLCPK